jgi:hypothetical protein
MNMAADQPGVEVEVLDGGEALGALNRSEIDMQISTAKQYPRELAKVRKTILELATIDRQTAEACFYALPRGGKAIEGPSVRLAEIIAASYGNLRCASRIISIDDTHVVCQGACIDMENNVASSVEVRRRITDKNGRRYNDDMITVTANAASAIAFRNAVFKVVPRAFYASVEDDIRKVGFGEERDMEETRKAALTWFEGQGVTKKQILDLLNETDGLSEASSVEDLYFDHIRILRGIVQAINDNETTIEEVFGRKPNDKANASAEKAKAALEKKKGKGKKQDEKPAAPEPCPEYRELEARYEEQDAKVVEALKGLEIAFKDIAPDDAATSAAVLETAEE